jgi:heme peroxidase
MTAHERHARRRFYVLGDGVYAEDDDDEEAGGHLIVDAEAAHAASGAPDATFRFSRIAPGSDLQLDGQTRKALAEAMTVVGGHESDIPSGFTYLGQFIDHDLTFDRSTVALGDPEPPSKMLQGRSPALDLDSLYARGPHESPRFYRDDHLHLKAGGTNPARNDGFDLPREGATPSPARIPDHRNDENLAVAQTHLAFIRFHNRVVETLQPTTPAAVLFQRARRQVTRHYQWMIKTDFLPRVCDETVVDDVFTNGRKIVEVGVPPTQVPTMPIEFSVAAYRLGHSMVRQAYNWNAVFPNGAGTLEKLFEFSGTSGNLGGDFTLPDIWIADFRRLYDFGTANRPDLVVPPAQFNHAMSIDTNLVHRLAALPAETLGQAPGTPATTKNNLAFRNLTRARMVRLPTGQEMTAFLNGHGVPVTELTAAEIESGAGNGITVPAAIAAEVAQHTPLWFYVLREAELNGGRLTGVGARIVAEVFHRAIEGSSTSILRTPNFTPSPELGSPDGQTFRMVDLLLFAFEGNADLLNPNGPEA